MGRSTTPWRAFALALISAVLVASLAPAQIPYYYNPTAGMAPEPKQEKTATRTEPNRSIAPSAVAGAGLMAGEIMPFILQNDTLFSLPPLVYIPRPDYRAQVWLRVPPAAQVWFNDARTSQVGEIRHYTSPPLTPGKTYSYKVRVRWMDGGKPVEKERRIEVQARGQTRGDFLVLGGNNPSTVPHP